jgi:hypothetical protein
MRLICALIISILITRIEVYSQCPSYDASASFLNEIPLNKYIKGKIRKINYTEQSYSPEGLEWGKVTGYIDFNLKGIPIQAEEKMDHLRWQRVVREFDQVGNEKSLTGYYQDNGGKEVILKKYDSKNNLVQIETYLSNEQKPWERLVYEYTDDCSEIIIRTFDSNGKEVTSHLEKLTFNIYQQLAMHQVLDSLDGIQYEEIESYEYNDQGYLKSKSHTEDGGIVDEKMIYTYEYFDAQKKVMKKCIANENNYFIYDRTGNWIEKRDGNTLIKRTILYY